MPQCPYSDGYDIECEEADACYDACYWLVVNGYDLRMVDEDEYGDDFE